MDGDGDGDGGGDGVSAACGGLRSVGETTSEKRRSTGRRRFGTRARAVGRSVGLSVERGRAVVADARRHRRRRPGTSRACAMSRCAETIRDGTARESKVARTADGVPGHGAAPPGTRDVISRAHVAGVRLAFRSCTIPPPRAVPSPPSAAPRASARRGGDDDAGRVVTAARERTSAYDLPFRTVSIRARHRGLIIDPWRRFPSCDDRAISRLLDQPCGRNARSWFPTTDRRPRVDNSRRARRSHCSGTGVLRLCSIIVDFSSYALAFNIVSYKLSRRRKRVMKLITVQSE